jgi:hypothetical protein
MSTRRRSKTAHTGATLWSGSYCAGCPAALVCPSQESGDACTDPALYHPSAAHPAKLQHSADPTDFDFPDFTSGGSALDVSPSRAQVLVLSDGAHTSTVRLKGAISRLRSGSNGRRHGMAVLHGHDPKLFALLEQRARLGSLLVDAGFTSVVSPGYSTWEPFPPWESLLNQALTAPIATELAGHIPTIPTVGWRRHEELPRWTDWLLRNERKSFALHAATVRTPREWEWWMMGLRTMRALLSEHDSCIPHLFVNGPCTADRVASVVHVWGGDVTFLTQQPWLLALHGKVLSHELQEAPEDDGLTVLERLHASEASFERFVRTQAASALRSLPGAIERHTA